MSNKNIFICKKCGNVFKFNNGERFNIIHETILCNCGEQITISDSYPNLDALDLKFSADQIYRSAEEQDLENRKRFIQDLKKNNQEFSDDKIELVIKLYEKNKEKREDNNPKILVGILDDLEKELLKNKFNYIECDAILTSLVVTMKNRMRKPFIVISSAIIEMLFNDFFYKLIEYKFDEKGSEIIKRQYCRENINKCIIIADAFLSGKLKENANEISDNYIKRWEELREKRNKIVHNNNIYITKDMMLKASELLNDSIDVFSKLKSELYNK